jgi:hypothetical protein
MRALQLPEAEISTIKSSLEDTTKIENSGHGVSIQRVFNIQELVAAGFEESNSE